MDKSIKKGGRPLKEDPAVNEYRIRLSDEENAKFLTLFEQSGMRYKTSFILARIFEKEFKVHISDKNTLEFCSKFSSYIAQIRAIGVNYNQVVKALHINHTEKRALFLLFKLEKMTIELVEISKEIIELSKEFEQKWSQK